MEPSVNRLTRKPKCWTGLLYALALFGAAGTGLGAEPPNIIFVLMDDFGWKDLGCFGAKLYETPNIDALCARGVKFTQAYTSASMCAPTRASAMTGKNPEELGMWNHLHHVPKSEKGLASYLKEAGYQTWHVGKWHFGRPEDGTLPEGMGFDVNIGGDVSWGPSSYFWPYGIDVKTGLTSKHPRTFVPNLYKKGQEGEYLMDRLGEEASALIKQRGSSKPFFLNFWHYAVHNAKQGKPGLVKKYKEKIARLVSAIG